MDSRTGAGWDSKEINRATKDRKLQRTIYFEGTKDIKEEQDIQFLNIDKKKINKLKKSVGTYIIMAQFSEKKMGVVLRLLFILYFNIKTFFLYM